MTNTYISPSGNPEVWKEKPQGYYTVEEWLELNPPEPEPELSDQEKAKDLSMTKAEFLILVTGLTKQLEGVEPVTLDAIETYLATDENARMRFTYANTVERSHPLLDTVSAAFGVSGAMLDTMFIHKDVLIELIDSNQPIPLEL